MPHTLLLTAGFLIQYQANAQQAVVQSHKAGQAKGAAASPTLAGWNVLAVRLKGAADFPLIYQEIEAGKNALQRRIWRGALLAAWAERFPQDGLAFFLAGKKPDHYAQFMNEWEILAPAEAHAALGKLPEDKCSQWPS